MHNPSNPERIARMYVQQDTLSTRITLHQKYSTNPYGWFNWVFDQYALNDAPDQGTRILELGCGNGEIWASHAEHIPSGTRITLTDFSPLMLEKARARVHHPSVDFAQVDVQQIPYADTSFDVVIANHMLYHVPDKAHALCEIARVLRPGGRFFASTLAQNTMGELQAIYLQLKDRAEFVLSQNHSFTLDNGAAILAPHFASIERRDYPDSLEVTELDDLMAYILSYCVVPEEVRPELRALLEAGIGPNGAFHISKEQGIFVCTR